MSMWKTMLANLIAGCDVHTMASFSRRDYHVPGLDYVCLLQSINMRAKLYFCPPGLPHNEQGFLVNPHNHAHNFHTFVVQGWMRETQFEAVAPNPRSQFRWFEFEHQGGGATQDATFLAPREVTLIASASVRFRPVGVDTNYLRRDKIHTIEVAHDEPTILFLLEYRNRRASHKYHGFEPIPTRYFSTRPEVPNVSGLYQPMPEDWMRTLLGNAREILESYQ